MKTLKEIILEAEIKTNKLDDGDMFVLKRDWSFNLSNIKFAENHRYVPSGTVNCLTKMAKGKNSLVSLEMDMDDTWVNFAKGSEFKFKTMKEDLIILSYMHKGQDCVSIALESYDFDSKFFQKVK